MPKLLLIEPEPALLKTLVCGLEAEGYIVDVARDGRAGEHLALTTHPDLLVVDGGMTGQDGPGLVKRVRAAHRAMPILLLTRVAEPARCTAALDAGADDYLTKPFSFDVFSALLRTLMRRAERRTASHTALPRTPLRLDAERRTAHLDGRPLGLRLKEFLLLRELLRHTGSAVGRTVLAERVWGTRFTSDDAINMTVSSLRRKLRKAGSDEAGIEIETIRSVGYRLNDGPG